MHHYAPPVSSYSYGIPVAPSPSVTVSSNWQSHSPLNIATGLHLHHKAISHPARNVWGCSGMSSQGMSPSLLHSSSPMSSCVRLCCSDREGSTAHRLQSPCGTFQTSRTTPNSPCMGPAHGGPSILALSSAFGSIPVIGPASQYTSVPTMSISHSMCSPVNYSRPSISVQSKSDPTYNPSNSQTRIQSCITPARQTHYHSASVCTGHNQSQQGSIIGPRQNGPVGSSPVHHTQDLTCSLLGDVMDRDCSSSLCQERTD